jgi:hypothetical protein
MAMAGNGNGGRDAEASDELIFVGFLQSLMASRNTPGTCAGIRITTAHR